ncbi:hypothetical protein J1614_006957 [Plenodomus biglobosus]|nr:hypothetical protein J1614_006957 [Plenodomus biglobosus]
MDKIHNDLRVAFRLYMTVFEPSSQSIPGRVTTSFRHTIYTLLSLSSALFLASSEALGLFKVAFRPPATLLGFLSPPDLDAGSISPPFSAFSRTSRECCLDSSEVSKTISVWSNRQRINVLGLFRLALWPPITFPELADMMVLGW